MSRRDFLRSSAILALAPMAASGAPAPYPSRPVRLVVPFAPGGGSDAVARMVGPLLTERLGQSVVVDYKGGASGRIAGSLVSRADPDGYTLLLSNPSPMTIGPMLAASAPYDPMRDFKHIALLGTFANAVFVRADHPAKTMREFLDLAGTKANQLTYASAGVGSIGHLTGELLREKAGVSMLHVPYRGTGPALIGLLAGNVDAILTGLPVAESNMKEGKIRLLAVASKRRLEEYPDTPTLAEIVPGVEGEVWSGISAPADTPASICSHLEREATTAMRQPDIRKRFADVGLTTSGIGQAEFTRYVAEDIARWGPVVKALNLKDN
ncbi:Tripartite tricarboxylate transporter family receptor [Pigmentiphaga humi]|uniref:Tripartite tricarboxylate transporter family receptor n=1 Tax=Pigmentiphaga humi TaxID=2478468 RepID=A0A3P4B5T6_9BURK|nr:tripartite tricarboxylate transporter substrate binding protein [Pigmentiphaga humi]VCU71673.1 Tripartite tricarboxylate transporter family receptor [Pigmentiphaga humi]